MRSPINRLDYAAALASTIFLKLDVLTLSYYRSPAEVGAYAAALALVGRLNVLKGAVLTTAFPEACRRRGPELRAFVGQSLRLTGIATLALLPLFAIGGWLIVLLYGPAYGGAAPAFTLLLAAYLIGLNAEPAAYVLWPLERPRWIAASDLVQLAFRTCGIYLCPDGTFVLAHSSGSPGRGAHTCGSGSSVRL